MSTEKVAMYKEEIYKRAFSDSEEKTASGREEQVQQFQSQLAQTHPLYPAAVREHLYPEIMREQKTKDALKGGGVGGIAGGIGGALLGQRGLRRLGGLGLAGAGVGALAGRARGGQKVRRQFEEAGKDYDQIMGAVEGSKDIVERDVNRVMKQIQRRARAKQQ